MKNTGLIETLFCYWGGAITAEENERRKTNDPAAYVRVVTMAWQEVRTVLHVARRVEPESFNDLMVLDGIARIRRDNAIDALPAYTCK